MKDTNSEDAYSVIRQHLLRTASDAQRVVITRALKSDDASDSELATFLQDSFSECLGQRVNGEASDDELMNDLALAIALLRPDDSGLTWNASVTEYHPDDSAVALGLFLLTYANNWFKNTDFKSSTELTEDEILEADFCMNRIFQISSERGQLISAAVAWLCIQDVAGRELVLDYVDDQG